MTGSWSLALLRSSQRAARRSRSVRFHRGNGGMDRQSRRFQSTWQAPSSQRAVGTLVQDQNEDEFDEEVEQFTRHWLSELLPRYKYPAQMSSLDLELGEGSRWDGDWFDEPDEEPTPPKTKKQSALDMLVNFDPQSPPKSDDPEDLQLWLECEAQQESVLRYQNVVESARARKDYASLSLVQRQVLRWFQPLCEEIASMQREYLGKEKNARKGANIYGPYLCILSPEKLAVICAHEAILHLLLRSGADGRDGVPFVSLAKRIGESVQEEVLVHQMLYKRFRDSPDAAETDELEDATEEPADDPDKAAAESKEKLNKTMRWAYSTSHLRSYLEELSRSQPTLKKRRLVNYAIRRARQVAEREEEWSESDKVKLGAALFQVLLNKATVHDGQTDEMAFTYEKRWFRKDKLQAFVRLHDSLYNMVVNDKVESLTASTTRQKPMIVPPKPWTSASEGGYLWLRSDLMRFHGSHMQKEALSNADLSTVFDGLNALGRVAWKINPRVLDVAKECWERNIPLGDIPSRTDFDLPAEPIPPTPPAVKLEKDTPAYEQYGEEKRRFREALSKYRRTKQKNMDLLSLRCSAMLKLDQGEKFKDFDSIYFPYNVDFRGRAYPVPPHLSNVGSDLCRGMLKFSESKPLGPRGLYWLKVHLANFAGADKMSFEERAKFVDDRMDLVRESVDDPFGGERWWMTLDDPFQGLATCYEIVDAIDSGDPESYLCSLPVHMDGSCNGLQHYAALGRDRVGGKAVNLCDYEEPQDVYIGVMHEVIRRVAEEAERHLEFDTSAPDLSRNQKKALSRNRSAKLVNGLIDRGVVKRTVMTSVYGVTFIGARTQIQEKIEDKLEAQGVDIDESAHEIFQACGYLAKVTMDVMGDLFTGAKQTMNWLTTCARLITQHGYPVAWITPIGLPAVQPYRQKKSSTVVTLMQVVTLAHESDELPIHKQRQVSAFPPNYVHSLDSSHMLLTALEMDKLGLTFSAVHDSFWTHACDIDEMNDVLRDVFVQLYDRPLLEQLKQTWEIRYPDLEFPDLPKRGKLDLKEVKRAKYFFQ